MAKPFAVPVVLVAGFLSAGLYAAVVGLGLGFLFMFLPLMPLLWLGLSRTDAAALHSSLIATLFITVVISPIHALLFLLTLSLPATYLCFHALKRGQFGPITVWFPFIVLAARAVAACSFLMLALTLYHAGQDAALPALVTTRIHDALTLLLADQPELDADTISSVAERMSFLVFPATVWMWALSLYLHALIVNQELVRRKQARRESLRIQPFAPPNWMISLILIAALASLIGGKSLAFWGQSSLILLIFPYFLLGAALIHERSRKVESRGLILFLLYFSIALLAWPVLIVAGYGLYFHVNMLNKYLSSGGTSTKN